MNAAALIVAAGQGQRFGGPVPKQFALLAGAPVLAWSLQAFARRPQVETIVVVVDGPDGTAAAQAAARAAGLASVRCVTGGGTRTESVKAGLAALLEDAPMAVCIHDAARPGLTGAHIDALLDALAAGADGAAPGLPPADALKLVIGDRIVGEAPRAGIWRVQTPQAFRFDKLWAAYQALEPGTTLEDDAAVARAAGMELVMTAGDLALTKITYPADLTMLERLLGAPVAPCVGSGVDAHRFGPGDHVVLCGVRIAHTHGLIGHSDADAAWHALTDALLGALAAGDIGAHFPPSDPQWRGAPSELFLRHAVGLAREAGAQIVNADLTILCERPKIGPHREAMQARTAEVLALPANRVGIKATTTEGMGFLGRQEGLAALATVQVLRRL